MAKKSKLLKYLIKLLCITFVIITLGVVALILFFQSEREIKYEDTSSKKVELSK